MLRRGLGSRSSYLLLSWVLLLTLAILAPTLRRGYVLTHDMVFTPRQSLLPDSLGAGSALPRAVPVDAVVSVLTTIVSGQVVEKAALLLTLFFAGWGAGVLVPSGSTLVRCLAVTLYLWNPYVAERLFIGHWSLLVAYAALPWLVRSLLTLRAGGTRAWATVVPLLALSAVTPGGGLISALTALPVLAWPGIPGRLRDTGRLAGVWVFVNAPWWLPGALHGATGVSSASGVDAFAARAELPLGSVGSLLGLGGIWDADVVPASRGSVVALVAALLWPVLAIAGWDWLRREWGGGAVGLLAAAVLGTVLAAAGAVPGASEVLRWAVVSLPGVGLLRDGQRLVAPLALLLAVAAPLGLARLVQRLAEPAVRPVVLGGLLLLPIVVLPDLAWGGLGRLHPVHYPADWQQVRSILANDRQGGDVVALPWQPYRQFSWNGRRTVYDPAPRFMTREVLLDGSLTVGGLTVPTDDPRSARVGALLSEDRVPDLRLLGVGWFLVEKGTPGVVDPALLQQGVLVFDGPTIALYRIGQATGGGWSRASWLVVSVDLIVLLTVAASVILLARFWPVRPSPRLGAAIVRKSGYGNP